MEKQDRSQPQMELEVPYEDTGKVHSKQSDQASSCPVDTTANQPNKGITPWNLGHKQVKVLKTVHQLSSLFLIYYLLSAVHQPDFILTQSLVGLKRKRKNKVELNLPFAPGEFFFH